MNYAIDIRSRSLVSAAEAKRNYGFLCPSCGAVVYRHSKADKLPLFRHYPGEEKPDCAAFRPNPSRHTSEWITLQLDALQQRQAQEPLLDELRASRIERRSAARWRLVQALYQWQLTEMPIETLKAQFMQELSLLDVDADDNEGVDLNHFEKLLHGIIKRAEELDAGLSEVLDRPLEQLDPVEQAILRIGLYELRHCNNVPWRVAINEAVELSKRFGSLDESAGFINGALDKLAQRQQLAAKKAPKGKR